MKHRVAGKKLNRNSKHRQALFKNLQRALILHGAIETTEAKAKVLRRLIDKQITQAKKGSLHSRRLIHAYFNQKQITHRLVDTIAPSFGARTSGYTRLIPLGVRRGDDTMMVRVEFTDPIIEPMASTPEKTSAAKTQPKTKKTAPATSATKSSE